MVKRAVKTAEVGRSKAHMVAATIEQDILTGRLPFGQQLESENELVERFAVSRNTVRKGLDLLTNGGLITRKGGIGSFVTFNGQAIDGTLGWTMACGSGRVLADLLSGRKPEIDTSELAMARYEKRFG